MNNNIICPECSTVNEPQYEYCKNCGTKLKATPQSDETPKSEPFTPEQHHNPNNGEQQQTHTDNSSQNSQNNADVNNSYSSWMPNEIDGVPFNEVVLYTGHKSTDLIGRFIKMKNLNQKTSWSWPLALIAFFFGFTGSAVWLFYRKMYKLALIVLAVAVVFSTASILIVDASIGNPSVEIDAIMNDYINGKITDTEYLNAFFDMFFSIFTPMYFVTSFISWVISITYSILFGLFAVPLYKKHTINSIKRFKASCVQPEYYHYALRTLGGTSTGMLAVGIAACVFIPLFCQIFSTVLLFIL